MSRSPSSSALTRFASSRTKGSLGSSCRDSVTVAALVALVVLVTVIVMAKSSCDEPN